MLFRDISVCSISKLPKDNCLHQQTAVKYKIQKNINLKRKQSTTYAHESLEMSKIN